MSIYTKLSIVIISFLIVSLLLLFGVYFDKSSRLDAAENEITYLKADNDSLIAASIKQSEKIDAYNEIGKQNEAELSEAKQTIDQLRSDIANGKRVYIKAKCDTVPTNNNTSTGSVGNERTAQLTDTAKQDYLRLREMMIENFQQTKYLQDYINEVCLK